MPRASSNSGLNTNRETTFGLAAPVTVKGYKRYAWVLVLIWPAIYGLLSLLPLVGGYSYAHTQGVISQVVPSSTPQVTLNYLNELARSDGLLGAFLAFLLVGLAATSYRKGQRLAWYVLFWFFLTTIADLVLSAAEPTLPGTSSSADMLFLVLLAVMALGLILPYRLFFPKNPRVSH